MYIFNSFNYVPLKSVVIDALKAKGVKYKFTKKIKDESLIHKNGLGPKVFNVPLQHLEKTNVSVKEGQAYVEVPQFLVSACDFAEQRIATEGIFRKGGSAGKQRDLKELINSGKSFDETHHIIDVCNLVKLFFREMPEPLLPQYCHEMLLSCLLLSGESAQREALLLCCLLLHTDHLATLVYFMEFLAKVAKEAQFNKMDAKNLAIVFTPSLMPIDPKASVQNNLTINHHIAVIELLIKSACDLGVVPVTLAEQAALRRSKKRRSASITRMFTGIRKMVGRGPSPPKNVTPCTPPFKNPQRKRKSTDVMPPAITVKRRKEMAETTPRLCRMGGYSQSSLRMSDGRLRNHLGSSERRKSEGANDEPEEAATQTNRKSCKKQGLKSSKSTSNLMISKKNLERKLSHMTWRKRKSTPGRSSSPQETGQEELMLISKREYEIMRKRVNSMERLLEEHKNEGIKEGIRLSLEPENLAKQLDKDLRLSLDANDHKSPPAAGDSCPAASVQEEFERTVVQSEQLEPQIRKSMRLRWSSEGRVARSPSERKIGSIRRRSRELARSNSAGARTNLQRGRPNTRQTGLRSPRELSNPKSSKPGAKTNMKPSSHIPISPAMRKLCETPDRRNSIVSIRRNNPGMVQAKAKFFDSLNHSTGTESDQNNRSMELRLQSVRRELGMQSRPPVIKAALTTLTSHSLKTPRSTARATPRPRTTPLKALPPDVQTPTRRSPRILARKLPQHCAI